MAIQRDTKTGTYTVQLWYTDYTGKKKRKHKRGFARLRDAKEWEAQFIQNDAKAPEMTFSTLSGLYLEDKKQHTKLLTYETKKNRLDKWILPYFGDRKLQEITPANIRKWQGDLKQASGANGKPLSPGYLQNIVTELSSVFNFACRYYGLADNPARIAGNTVGKKQRSLTFWTYEQFQRFIATFDPLDPYRIAFTMLYYTGMRKGELLALTAADIDLDNGTIDINKTYHVINGKAVITPPKTEKSIRKITIPAFLSDLIRAHETRIYGLTPGSRIFCYSDTRLAAVLDSHLKALPELPRIRIHDFRHSHASLLIDLGFSALLVSERLGHENVSATLDIYSHLFPSKQTEVSDRLQKLHEKNRTILEP